MIKDNKTESLSCPQVASGLKEAKYEKIQVNIHCFMKIYEIIEILVIYRSVIIKGGFFSESAIRFLDLQISKKYSKKLS